MKCTKWSARRLVRVFIRIAVAMAVTKFEAAISAAQPEATTAADRILFERGMHHRIWRGTKTHPRDVDATPTPPSVVVEMGTGLNYLEAGEWKETKEEFVIINGQAVAGHGPHQVTLAANLNSPGAVQMIAPDRHRFRSHVLGLAYTDRASGRSVLIAEVENCQGALVAPNQVIYVNALNGECRGDVRYTYSRAGFEQDILLRTAPPSPAAWGLRPETTRLEVFTEFLEAPPVTRRYVTLKPERDQKGALHVHEADLVDERLDFGVMKFVQGRALAWPEDESHVGLPMSESTPTGKSFEVIAGRTFLIEKVDYAAIRATLSRLPQMAVAPPRDVVIRTNRLGLAAALQTPASDPGRWRNAGVVQGDLRQPALVLDYYAVNGSLTNWTFASDRTYYIAHDVDLHGLTVLEGTVVKFAPGTSMRVWEQLECRTSDYRPAIFSGRDDDSIGTRVPGSTGRLNGTYASPALLYASSDSTNGLDLHHVHIRHATVGVRIAANGGAGLSHLQVVRGGRAVESGAHCELFCRNFLFADLKVGFYGTSDGAVKGEHGTFHRLEFLASGDPALALTNCLLVAVTNRASFVGAHVIVEPNEAGIFQTVGEGAHYLAARSPFRNAGTISIHPALGQALRRLTTYPPIRLSGAITRSATLRPQASRDADLPDLGYHYVPLDYVWNDARVANARMVLTNGVAIGIEGYPANFGLELQSGGQLIIEGNPDRMAHLIAATVAQEGAITSRGIPLSHPPLSFIQITPTATVPPKLQWRFVETSIAGGNGYHLGSGLWLESAPFLLRDCQFAGGQLWFGDTGFQLINCLFDRVNFQVEGSGEEVPREFHHNLFHGGRLEVNVPGRADVGARNNLFDQTTLGTTGLWRHSHNAFRAGSDALKPPAPSERVLDRIDFESGPFGRFYYPTRGGAGTLANLLDAGSGPASQLGFAHYTCVPDGTREATTTIDIGFHYVAATNSGQLLDSDDDGWPDFREDANGNAVQDAGETRMDRYDSPGHLAGPLALEVFTPLK